MIDSNTSIRVNSFLARLAFVLGGMDVKQKGHQEIHVNVLIIETVVVNVQELLLFLP
jgi:hypothetical protein